MMEGLSQSALERDYQRYRHLLELWSRENAIKTQKLQFFLLTNALLTISYVLTPSEPPAGGLICLVGATLSLIWTLSLGRTIRFQKRWQELLYYLSERYQTDSRFQVLTSREPVTPLPFLLRLTGSLSSKYYLIGGPLLGIFFWLWMYGKSP